MVTDRQVRMLMTLINKEEILAAAAAKAGMDEKTARKWRDSEMLPSQSKVEHTWQTRPNPFEDVWEEVRAKLKVNSGLEAKTLFEDLQRRYPGRFSDGQIRSFQRRIKAWRALEGPQREVFFPQVHNPGALCESDFLHGWESWRLPSRDSFSIIWFIISYFLTPTGRPARFAFRKASRA
jgi:hypothetical protein